MLERIHRTTVATALLSLVAAAQTTWYVDSAASPPGAGTPQSPFSSAAFALVQPSVVSGDTLLLAPGVYSERIDISLKRVSIASSGGPLVTELRAPAGGALIEAGFDSSLGIEIVGLSIVGRPDKATIGVAGGSVSVRDCIVRGHRSLASTVWFMGSGLHSRGGMYVENCTVVDNRIGISSNQLYGGSAQLVSSLFAHNLQHDVSPTVDPALSCSAYCCLWLTGAAHHPFGGPVAGNLNLAPLLWDPLRLDFHLAPRSPCIDSGNPLAPLDPDGTRREIGALIYDANYAPAPTVYCTSKVNSLGCAPAMAASGSAASASGAQPFFVNCTNQLSHRSGLMFYGLAPTEVTFQGGYLCVKAPTRRTPLLNSGGVGGASDCSGAFSFEFSQHVLGGADPELVPGSLVYAQYWSRDSASSHGSNRSDALRFAVLP